MLKAYFEEDAMGYRMVRIPIDSCDFSLGHYEAVEDEKDRAEEKRIDQKKYGGLSVAFYTLY